ncbi:cyclopropane fatty acyl phospholipid synthase [Kushneria aurantia]|uniref:Cyclopropane fatty acyl phospholipid synthase n=1 Tax=Kushneria aurantia TaxID=504092 RepID=A0ABV6G6Q4_9GAMM|nr:cyclopropane fatty acyl phospholipid synthase [Kushneria aurantia]
MISDTAENANSDANTRARKLVQQWLETAGIQLNGERACDIRVHNPGFYTRVIRNGSLGLGESYMEGWWSCERIDQFIEKLLRANLGEHAHTRREKLFYQLQTTFTNLQSKTRAFIVGEQHYDFGNDLFEAMLDDTMCYSCGYWKEATNLYEAQVAKLDLAARKLRLEPGMRVLDIGCGWGSFAAYAARHYGVHVTGITISKEQAELARKRCEGLDVEIVLEDYRDLEGSFDRIVSIGMFEHVGQKNYSTYFSTVERLLADDGLFMLHTIGSNNSKVSADPFINKYIFPNGVLPSVAQIIMSTEDQLVMEDWQNFGADYDRTLMAWLDNVESAWPSLPYEESTQRMFRYYLASCAGAFRARDLQLWQVVFSKKRSGRYDAPR